MSKTTKKAVAKKSPVKKVAVKKATKKVAKKEAPKKAVAKKSATGNKELDLMLAKVKEATKKGDKKVVVYTTSKESHKANTSEKVGFGVNDLKPKLYEAYKHMLIKFDVKVNLVDEREMVVEWIVNLKK
jgi:hypothetical protein